MSAPRPTIQALPTELLVEIMYCVVQADDLRDYSHLSQTCKAFFATFWADATSIWRQVFLALYDPVGAPADAVGIRGQDSTAPEGNTNAAPYSEYKKLIKDRLRLFKEVRSMGQRLDAGFVPWRSLKTHGTEYGDEIYATVYPMGRMQRTFTVTGVELALMDLIKLGAQHANKNLYWIQTVTTPNLWACGIHLWMRGISDDELSIQAFHGARTICGLFQTLSQIAAIDPCVLSGLYWNKYSSFQLLRRMVFWSENRTMELHPTRWTKYRSRFPWSMSQVFFMTLFCSPIVSSRQLLAPARQRRCEITAFSFSSAKDINANVTNTCTGGNNNHWGKYIDVDADGAAVKAGIRRRAVPSWFNFGDGAEDISPIPLIPSRVSSKQSLDHNLSGKWAGYYAYVDYALRMRNRLQGQEDDVPGVERLDPKLESRARGIRVDKRMSIDFVDWSPSSSSPVSRMGGARDRDSGGSREVLSRTDERVFGLVDSVFHRGEKRPGVSGVCSEDDKDGLEDEDDIEDQHYHLDEPTTHVFCGRGRDAIGEFGIRGCVSHRTGLVRMVKAYLGDGQAWEHAPVKGTLPFEFGNQPHQLSYDFDGSTVVWYYRGRLGPAGMMGIYSNRRDTGPFWMYRQD